MTYCPASTDWPKCSTAARSTNDTCTRETHWWESALPACILLTRHKISRNKTFGAIQLWRRTQTCFPQLSSSVRCSFTDTAVVTLTPVFTEHHFRRHINATLMPTVSIDMYRPICYVMLPRRWNSFLSLTASSKTQTVQKKRQAIQRTLRLDRQRVDLHAGPTATAGHTVWQQLKSKINVQWITILVQHCILHHSCVHFQSLFVERKELIAWITAMLKCCKLTDGTTTGTTANCSSTWRPAPHVLQTTVRIHHFNSALYDIVLLISHHTFTILCLLLCL